MHGQGFFHQAFVYLAAAVIVVPIAKRLGLGSVLGYLIAGMAIGPFALGLVGSEGQDVLHFAEFGVVLMLFVIGLELQPALLWRLRSPILGMGGLQVSATAAALASIAIALGLPWQSAVAIGLTLSLSSTAIVLQTLAEKRLLRTDAGQSGFAVLLFQDIAVIPMLALFPLLRVSEVSSGGSATISDGAAAHTGAHIAAESGLRGAATGHAGSEAVPAGSAHADISWIESLPGWAETLVVLGAVLAVVVAGRYLLRPCLRYVAGTHLHEIFTAFTLLLVVGIALLMTWVGLSPALGTFLAGVVLANSEYRHELEGDIEPFKGLLLGVFFIAVGASIDFAMIAARPALIAGLVAGLVGVKLLVLFALGRLFRMGLDQNLLFAFSLAQGGEFAFVLFSFATQNGVLGADIANPLVASVALSMALTPLVMLANERLLLPRIGTPERAERADDEIDESNPAIIAGFGHFGNIVGRFLRANGVDATVLEYDSDKVEALRRLGLRVFYGDASRLELLRAAGAGRAKLIVLAIDDPERMLGMVRTIRQHFPDLEILARAQGRQEAYALLEAGVEHIYRDTLDTSLRLAADAMSLLGRPAYPTRKSIHVFRRQDEAALRELAGMRHDKKGYVSLARQRIADLEALIRSEDAAAHRDRDAGWDTDSLRAEFGDPPTA